ncbi:SAM-dependent methyltransferase [Actinoplanes sp. GCM10030250]|uniref:SAM-dependent methyltransferase n=1 Tax=Actinoplanes sp. GCM10030250 TaxID=3273376 RepID=UPI003623143A
MTTHRRRPNRPNIKLGKRREAMASPHLPGHRMSRTELADEVNRALRELYPDDNPAAYEVDGPWIGKLERGDHHWPSDRRRAALRRALKAETDAEIGLHIARGENLLTPPPIVREHATIDTSTPHPARRYNYWLGGKDNFAADRESGDQIARAFPTVVTAARSNRAFLRRAVRYLAENGIRQFLDIGTGLPVPDNTHEIAQRVAPAARVLYVDNDPIVLTHARALLRGHPRGRTGYLEADVSTPRTILASPELAATLNLDRPVALLLVAVLHFIRDDDQALTIVKQLLGALPSGSYLVISHATMDFAAPAEHQVYEQMYAEGRTDARARPKSQISCFFEGLDIVAPGIVTVNDWRAEDLDDPDRPTSAEVAIYGAVGRVP